jgi:hypothetical protein
MAKDEFGNISPYHTTGNVFFSSAFSDKKVRIVYLSF